MRIFSVIFLLIAAFIPMKGAAPLRIYHADREINASSFTFPMPTDVQAWALEVRGLSEPENKWRLYWNSDSAFREARFVEISVSYDELDGLSPMHSGVITVGIICDGRDSVLTEKKFKVEATQRNFACTVIAEHHSDGTTNIFSGPLFPEPIYKFSSEGPIHPLWGVASPGKWLSELIVMEEIPDLRLNSLTGLSEEEIAEKIESSRDALEGIWHYFDRVNNPELARPGGEYRLATLKNSSGGYDIIYLNGARTNLSEWEPGMLKGSLSPTIFPGHYDLIWYDAVFEQISTEASANFNPTDGVPSLLELNFPLFETVIRFSRELKPLK